MKNINRWALMRNTSYESLATHSLEVAAVAHALAELGNSRLGRSYDADRAAVMGIYHDMPEILTGDMPTPVKYFNPEIRRAFGEIEKTAGRALLDTLPKDLQPVYSKLLTPDEQDELCKLVKAADKISALIKCAEEQRSGNEDFSAAYSSTKDAIKKMNCPEADIFLSEFFDSYSIVLDTCLAPGDDKK